MTKQPEIGDRVGYFGEHNNLISGLVAEVSPTVLKPGSFRVRVVDFHREIKDEGAGKWIDAENLKPIGWEHKDDS